MRPPWLWWHACRMRNEIQEADKTFAQSKPDIVNTSLCHEHLSDVGQYKQSQQRQARQQPDENNQTLRTASLPALLRDAACRIAPYF